MGRGRPAARGECGGALAIHSSADRACGGDHHLRSVFGRLGIRSRAELVRAALDGGLDAG